MDRRLSKTAPSTHSEISQRTHMRAELLEARETPSVSGLEDVYSLPALNGSNHYPTQVQPSTHQAQPLIQQARARYAVGTAGAGLAQVNVYDAGTGALLGIVNPFGRNYTGGVSVATGDVTGDGVEDLVVGAGAVRGQQPTVKVFDGRTLKEVASFNAYSASFYGGLTVAVGDVDGDGRADIVTGAGKGSISQVKVFSGSSLISTTGKQLVAQPQAKQNFIAFEKTFRGGVNVAVGDFNGDGLGDIVVGQGPGAGGVKVFNGKTSATMLDLKPLGQTFDLGVSVAAGDVDGNGHADLVVGAMRGPANVKVFNHMGTETAKYQALDGLIGARVATEDIDGDGKAEVLVAGGSGRPQVRVLNALNGQVRRLFPAMVPTYNEGLLVG